MVYTLYHLDDKREGLVYNRILDNEASLQKVLTVGRRAGDLQRWLSLLTLVNKQKLGDPNLKVLDYGCGWGTFLQVAQGPGVSVVGFDATSWKMEWARKQGITIFNSEKELFNEGPFDICVSTSVLEHLRNPVAASQAMARLLKPGGYALISGVVTQAAFPWAWKKIRRDIALGRPLPKEINAWEHLNYFNFTNFANMLGKAGFVPVKRQLKWLDGNKLLLPVTKLFLKKFFQSICLIPIGN